MFPLKFLFSHNHYGVILLGYPLVQLYMYAMLLARQNYGHPVEMSLFILSIHILRFLFAHKLRNDVEK